MHPVLKIVLKLIIIFVAVAIIWVAEENPE